MDIKYDAFGDANGLESFFISINMLEGKLALLI